MSLQTRSTRDQSIPRSLQMVLDLTADVFLFCNLIRMKTGLFSEVFIVRVLAVRGRVDSFL